MQQPSQKTDTGDAGRIEWVDILRFLAIFMVICCHCADPFNVSAEARSNPEFNFWGSVYGSLLRPCVPFFVMITGLLLLPVRIPAGTFYKKRLTRIAVPFVLWSVLYNLFPWISGLLGLPAENISRVFAYAPADASQSFGDALGNILRIPFQFSIYTVPFWYIYMLIGLYLYLPVFSAWVEKASRSQKKMFLGIWAVSLLLPYTSAFGSSDLFGQCAWNAFGTFYYFAGFSGYLLLGHFLTRELECWSWSKTLMVGIPAFAVGYLITFTGFRTMSADPACTEQELELFFQYCSPNVALMTLGLFLIVRKIRLRSARLSNIFADIARCGFGIYMIHYFAVGLGYALTDALAVPVSIRIPVTALIVFLCCWGMVSAVRRLIPRGARWIFG